MIYALALLFAILLAVNYYKIKLDTDPRQEARKLYSEAYDKWGFESDHYIREKTAKDVCKHICDKIILDVGSNWMHDYWDTVKLIITNSSHQDLYE